MNYVDFLKGKISADSSFGFKPLWLPDKLFDFQNYLTEWSIRKGRAAILADCGLGKSFMELVWAENILRKTNKPILVLTPLAVGPQMVREGEKFGIGCKITRTGTIYKGINVTNYQRLHYYDPTDFAGVVCDESSVLKHEGSETRKAVTAFLSKVQFRLLATATPAPNDYMELGTSSEALGIMGRSQMLGMFFTNGGESTQQWQLKGHARKRFWQWMCQWARAVRKPHDLGFEDKGFILPKMNVNRHVVKTNGRCNGTFGLLNVTLNSQRAERKTTIQARCQKVCELVPKNDFAVVWCHFNDEANFLEREIPGAVQVQGSDREELKEERLTAFSEGQIKILITKPKIGGFGLNWQHCNRMTFFPSHSFEQFYQAIRRCWRFGQKREVNLDIVSSQGESIVLANMRRKEKQADAMYDQLVAEMSHYQNKKVEATIKQKMDVPVWLLNGKR